MAFFGNMIFSRRLKLRRIQETDLDLLVAWSHTSEAYGAYLSPERFILEQLQQQLYSGALWNEWEKMFLVECKETGEAIGTIHYWRTPDKRETAIISLKVAVPEARCQGYGTEMQKTLILHLFNHEKIESVIMYTDLDNLPQQNCLRKLGFEVMQTLLYDDQQVQRTGYIFQLTVEKFRTMPIYYYHYE
jgi:RimJ/RimL family protein N-acetyltransferase